MRTRLWCYFIATIYTFHASVIFVAYVVVVSS